MNKKSMKVCVTGGAGYLGSFLVKELLSKGYFVNATLRNLRDESKVELLKGLANANTNLKLFEADIYNPHQFAVAIGGCHVVFHVATPLQHYSNNIKYKNMCEASLAGAKSIMDNCINSKTVKKVVYTASVVASSILKEDGSGCKDRIDENCWTPLNLTYQYSSESLDDYVASKNLSEQEVLSYNGKGIEVVSLVCGLVGGGTVQSSMSESMGFLISQGLNEIRRYKLLRFLEELLGKVPILHIQDAIDAHIFCMENSNVNGRVLCASDFLKSAEIARLIQRCHQPSITVPSELIEDTKRETAWGSKRMEEAGFLYKHDAEKTISDSLICAKNMGYPL